MKKAIILLVVFYAHPSFAAYQFSKIKDDFQVEDQLLRDLKSCVNNLSVSVDKKVRYKTGICMIGADGLRYLLISILGNFKHVLREFKKYKQNDFWLFSLRVHNRCKEEIPIAHIEP
jgi:hypothetical protein